MTQQQRSAQYARLQVLLEALEEQPSESRRAALAAEVSAVEAALRNTADTRLRDHEAVLRAMHIVLKGRQDEIASDLGAVHVCMTLAAVSGAVEALSAMQLAPVNEAEISRFLVATFERVSPLIAPIVALLGPVQVDASQALRDALQLINNHRTTTTGRTS